LNVKAAFTRKSPTLTTNNMLLDKNGATLQEYFLWKQGLIGGNIFMHLQEETL